MNLEMLCGAVQETCPWLEEFRKETYAEAFRAYSKRFGPAYLEAVRETGTDGEDLSDLAETILNGIEAGWKRQRPWNRGAVRVSERRMAALYLSPMLLALEEPGCRSLCALLRDGWAARWPKEAYQTAGFAELKSGFRTTFMGIELRSRRRDREEE